MTISDDPKGWRFDRSIPLSLAFIMLTQLAGGVWLISHLSARVDEQERRVIRNEAALELMRSSDAQLSTDIRVLVTRVEALIDRIDRLEAPPPSLRRSHPE